MNQGCACIKAVFSNFNLLKAFFLSDGCFPVIQLLFGSIAQVLDMHVQVA